MKTFTFLCVRGDGAVPSMELSECPDAAAAQVRAAQLLAEHHSCSVVEVWDETELCMSLSRAPQDLSAAAG